MDIYLEIVVPALEESRSSMRQQGEFEISKDLPLMGAVSPFDSLAFVSFVILVEEKIAERTDRILTLVDDKAFAARSSPFKTVGTLVNYIEERLGDEKRL